MRKAKVIAVLALTVVMLAAMTGQVLGWGGAIDSTDSSGTSKILFVERDYVYATFVANSDPDSNGQVNIYVTDNAEWKDNESIATTKTIRKRIFGVSASTSASTILIGTVGNGVGEIPFPGDYDIAVDLDEDGVYKGTGTGSEDFVNDAPFGCKAFTTEVPEFATIALPVVSVLGLLLFFNRRKHKKE